MSAAAPATEWKPISQLTLAEIDAEVERLRALASAGQLTGEHCTRLDHLRAASAHVARHFTMLTADSATELRATSSTTAAARQVVSAIVAAAARTRTPVSVSALRAVEGSSVDLVLECLERYHLTRVHVGILRTSGHDVPVDSLDDLMVPTERGPAPHVPREH